MSTNKSNPEAPRSKLVELFGSGKAKTLPSMEKAKDEGVLGEKMKTPRTKTIDSIVPSDTHHGHSTSSTPNFTHKKNTSGERLSSLPKLTRRSSNPRSYQKKIESTRTIALQKNRSSMNQSKTFELSIADSSADRALSPSSEGSNPTTRQKEMKKSSKREDKKNLSTAAKPQNVTSNASLSRKPSTEEEEEEEDDDGDDVIILRKPKNHGQLVRPLPKDDSGVIGSTAEAKGQMAGQGDIDGKGLVEVQPMSPINRYSGGQQGTSLLSRISQRYIIDPSRYQPNKDLHLHPEQQQQQQQQPSLSVLKTTTTKMAARDGLMGRQTVRMNKSLTESSRRSVDDDDDDDEDRMYCSSSESLSSNNNSSKKGNSMKLSSDGAFFSGQRSSYCSLKTFNNDLSTSGRVKSATNPKSRSHELTQESQPMTDGNQYGFRAGKRYERSNSLSLTGLGSGSSSTNLLPSLTLTSIPEKGLNPDCEEQSYHSQGSTRPKVLDLTQPSLEFGGCYPTRQSLDSARFLRLPHEGIGSPHLFPRRLLSQQSSPSTGDGGSICRWNAASSSSSSSLLSPPQQDPRRFHSSLPRSPKSPLGTGLALKYTQEPLKCAKSSAVDSTYDKSPRGFSLSASHISHNQELNPQPNGGHRRMFRGQGSLPLPGSQSCCLSRKNQSSVTSPCQQQQQQQQSPLKSLYSLDEDGDLHASVLSLISNTSSSVFSTMTEERQAQEIKRLRHELDTAHEKINSLTNQLNTNVYVVGAFEHSLSTMTNRLQKLTKSSELKDVELAKLKTALEEIERAKGQMSRTFNDQSLEINKQRVGLIIEEERSATLSPQAPQSCESVEGKKKNLLWTKLGHTFKRAFSKKKDGSDSETDVSCSSEFVAATPFKSPDLPCRRHSNHHLAGYRSVPSTPLVSQRRILEFFDSPSSKTNHKTLLAKATSPPNNTPAVSSGAIPTTPCPGNEESTVESEKLIASLKQQLHEKEMGLTDVRLEALSSAHMQEQLRETINQLKMELNQERSENERLRQLLNDLGVSQSKPGNPSRQKSINSTGDDQSKLLIRDPTASYGSLTMDEMKKSVPKYVVTVKTRLDDGKEVLVGSVNLTSKTKWETLDSTVNRIFQEYLYKVDASNTLGLSSKSIAYYRVGELKRSKGDPVPELLPCGYLVGHNTTIVITLNENLGHPGLELTSFESLLSKKCLERYLSLLQTYLNLIIAGPIKSGKTHLAHQLAHCVSWSISYSTYKKAPITYVNVNSVSKEDFQCFLTESSSSSSTISSSSSSSSSSHSNIVIIILDNLNHSIITSQLFVDFVESCSRKRKYLLGTMLTSEYRSSRDVITAKIQVSVLDSQSEPLQGLLSRHLQRRVIEEEIRQDRKLDADVLRYLKYLVQVCDHLCSFIRDQCSHTVDEIGPALFFSAPLDKNQFQSWFVELWNERIVPHMTFALSNHLKSNTAVHHDPSIWVKENLPWSSQDLLSLTPAPPPDLLMTSPRGRKVKRSKEFKDSQSSTNDDDDDDDKEVEFGNNNDGDRKESGVNADRLINTDVYQLASVSSSSSPPSSSSSSSSFKSKSDSAKTSNSSQKSPSSSSSSSLLTQLRANSVNVNDNNNHHHHHQFVRSPQVLRKTDGILKQVDPLTNMLHRLQEAAMTSSATPTAGRHDNLFLDDLGVYDNLNNNNNNNREINAADDINHNVATDCSGSF